MLSNTDTRTLPTVRFIMRTQGLDVLKMLLTSLPRAANLSLLAVPPHLVFLERHCKVVAESSSKHKRNPEDAALMQRNKCGEEVPGNEKSR